MTRRVITAREQLDMLLPWSRVAKIMPVRRWLGPNHPQLDQWMDHLQAFPHSGTDFKPVWKPSKPGPQKPDIDTIDWSNPQEVENFRDWHRSQIDMDEMRLDHNHDPNTNSGSVKAYHSTPATLVGTMFYTDGEIHDIGVHDDWKHRNIATNMFDMAKHHGIELHHSPVLTNDGKAWVQHLENRQVGAQ